MLLKSLRSDEASNVGNEDPFGTAFYTDLQFPNRKYYFLEVWSLDTESNHVGAIARPVIARSVLVISSVDRFVFNL